jgi:hypothetical protein
MFRELGPTHSGEALHADYHLAEVEIADAREAGLRLCRALVRIIGIISNVGLELFEYRAHHAPYFWGAFEELRTARAAVLALNLGNGWPGLREVMRRARDVEKEIRNIRQVVQRTHPIASSPGEGHGCDFHVECYRQVCARFLSDRYRDLDSARLERAIQADSLKARRASRENLSPGQHKMLPTGPFEDVKDESLLAEFYTAKDLTRLLGEKFNISSPSAVETFLRRFRIQYPDCAREVEGRRRNEPKYIYRTRDVWPDLTKHFGRK